MENQYINIKLWDYWLEDTTLYSIYEIFETKTLYFVWREIEHDHI